MEPVDNTASASAEQNAEVAWQKSAVKARLLLRCKRHQGEFSKINVVRAHFALIVELTLRSINRKEISELLTEAGAPVDWRTINRYYRRFKKEMPAAYEEGARRAREHFERCASACASGAGKPTTNSQAVSAPSRQGSGPLPRGTSAFGRAGKQQIEPKAKPETAAAVPAAGAREPLLTEALDRLGKWESGMIFLSNGESFMPTPQAKFQFERGVFDELATLEELMERLYGQTKK